ncbi:L-histidine N(alpha)-methyltransferase [Hyphomonas chukchiensis]|uniref:L-histidine N(alpha)-methyltransferase n=1 Tax=Hyphomonas chukchiensis TaxID=1280947 RepID=UPI0030F9B831
MMIANRFIPPATTSPFRDDVLDGLTRKSKTLPSRWLYDERGSELFEAITRLPEYYPTRIETDILRDSAADIGGLIERGAALVEYGAGASNKTRIILDALKSPRYYVPIDISGEFLLTAARRIEAAYPALHVAPRVADFLGTLALPQLIQGAPRLGFFPGSTIGNLTDLEIHSFLARCKASLGTGARFLLGYDLRKSPDILIPAYDDAQGVTAAFNLNILARINRELGADFDLSQFKHVAVWNEAQSRVEMHLESLTQQIVTLGAVQIRFVPGETIHTENSRKFCQDTMRRMCSAAGWSTLREYKDADNQFAVVMLKSDNLPS